jgi:hypothetical protein
MEMTKLIVPEIMPEHRKDADRLLAQHCQLVKSYKNHSAKVLGNTWGDCPNRYAKRIEAKKYREGLDKINAQTNHCLEDINCGVYFYEVTDKKYY